MKESVFKLNNGKKLKIITREGEIISVISPLKGCNTEKLENALRLAIKTDFEEFFEMFKDLRLNTSHYKMCKKILKEEKIQMEANIQKINRWIPED